MLVGLTLECLLEVFGSGLDSVHVLEVVHRMDCLGLGGCSEQLGNLGGIIRIGIIRTVKQVDRKGKNRTKQVKFILERSDRGREKRKRKIQS